MLEVKNLHAKVADNVILKGINLTINPGEVHAIMGPNGSGKSTLSKVIAGHPAFEILEGEIRYHNGKEWIDLTGMEAHERALSGVFLSFQYPIEIPGVSNQVFLREALNEKRKYQKQTALSVAEFETLARDKIKDLKMNKAFLERSINEGFSGGEKKKNEILQMQLLEPRLAFLDETDSGLDIDALQIVASGVDRYRRQDRSIVLVTHYQRLLNYIQPDFVHILYKGKIIKTGTKDLALKLENEGYEDLINQANAREKA